MKFTIISGLSGSGKTVALHDETIAFGIDARSGLTEITRLENVLRKLRKTLPTIETELIFIMARENVLVRRYSETRRAHPLSKNGEIPLVEAIRKEKDLLDAISTLADLTIDTSVMNVHQLNRMIRDRVGSSDATDSLSIQVQSFGFKHGVPMDSDYVFDVRCLPNPHWETRLRPLSGKDAEVAEFLEKSDIVSDMYQSIFDFLKRWIPPIADENRGYLSIAIGCTGGQHRSVYMVEKIAAALVEMKLGKVSKRHRELGDQ